MEKIKFIERMCKLLPRSSLKNVSPKNIVFITGCDSGLGFNLSVLCHRLNMTVISGCLDINSEGANILKKIPPSNEFNKNSSVIRNQIIPIELDLLKADTITNALGIIENLISYDDKYNFTALVNNAGIMCFGEFEWQTNRIFESQIHVNLLGTMKLTKQFLPLIRNQKSRIINITSHCSLHGLPGLGPYAASKAGLRFWNDTIRLELNKYDIKVVNFIPGSFVTVSNIVAQQEKYTNEMRNELTKEQKQFYGEYFERYNEYLKFISGPKKVTQIDDKILLEKFKLALLTDKPKTIYIHEPWRYTFYHWCFKYFPIKISDWFTKKFMSMPEYKPKKKDL